jgi:GDP-L-fucose synthase
MVGSALLRGLTVAGYSNLVVKPHESLDLTSRGDVEAFFRAEKPDLVMLAAARVGGIRANSERPAEFIYSNLAIQTNVIHECWRTGAALLFLGSSCVYPRGAGSPIAEESLLAGALEPTNEAYAVAKIAGIKMCEAYRRQYGCDFRCVMPSNVYGPGDNFDLLSGHFLAALMRKCHLAKLRESGDLEAIAADERKHGALPEDVRRSLGIARVEGGFAAEKGARPIRVEVWGSGTPRRELLFVDDLADACRLVCELSRECYDEACASPGGASVSFVNVGTGREDSIADLANLVREVVGTRSPIVFDPSKLDGTPSRLIDSSRIRALGWAPKRALREGIERTYASYVGAKT